MIVASYPLAIAVFQVPSGRLADIYGRRKIFVVGLILNIIAVFFCSISNSAVMLIIFRVLQGIIPICASCKRIRDDSGYWEQIETYINKHSGADFSHGICPDCMKKLYPDTGPGKPE